MKTKNYLRMCVLLLCSIVFTPRLYAAVFTPSEHTPANGTINVALDVTVKVTLRPGLTSQTPDWSGVTIKDQANNPVTGIEVVETQGFIESLSILTIKHDLFEYGKTYTATIPKGAIPGVNALAEDISWSFTTLDPPVGIETITPVSYYPTGNEVPLGNLSSVIFDKPVNTNGNPMFTGVNKPTITPGNILTVRSVTIDADNPNKLNIEHASTMVYETEYTIRVPKGAIVGLEEDVVWTYKTVAPVVEHMTVIASTRRPANRATDVELHAPVSVEVKPGFPVGVIDFNSRTSITDEGGESIAVDVGYTTTGAQDKITILHDDFKYGKTYTVKIDGMQINATLVLDTITWSFSTMKDPNATETHIKPIEGSYTPVINATWVLVQSPVQVQITPALPVDATIDWSDVSIKDGEGRPVQSLYVSVSSLEEQPDRSLLKISHANFDFEKTYTVLIPARAIDENTILDEITWSFTTKALEPMTALSWLPLGDTIALDAELSITFDKPALSNGYPNLSHPIFTLVDENGDEFHAYRDGYIVSEENPEKLVFNRIPPWPHPETPSLFKAETTYTATLRVAAIAGMVNDVTWTFKTKKIEKQPIEIISYDPVNGATDIALDAPVKLTYKQTSQIGVDYSGVTITDSQGNAVAGLNITTSDSFSPAATTIMAIGHSNFAEGKKYTVLIPKSTYANNPAWELIDDVTWSFSTEKYIGIPTIATGKVYAAEGKLYVSGYPSGSSVRILNAIGQVVSTQRVTSSNLSIDLAPGIYLVNLQVEGQTTTYKLIIDN